jgi:2-aminoadipate transaminase
MGDTGDTRFSRRVSDLDASPVREALAVLERPGMISFAGGLPAKETFPTLDVSSVPPDSLQYGPSEGDGILRRQVAQYVGRIGLPCSPEQVLILSGSQQGIDLVAKLFIDPATPVAVEEPTYVAALQVFRYFGADFRSLERSRPLAGMDRTPPAFAYVVPTFQNPTGYCYSAAERAAMASACDEASTPLFEDDPYRDLAYEACDRTPICAHLTRAPWIYQSSFSKSLAPGVRLGFLAASAEMMPYLVRLKQAADLHSSRVSQWLVLRQLEDTGFAARLAAVTELYRRKRDAFAAALARHFAALATWRVPSGGLFFWLRLNRPIDTRCLLAPAIDAGVAFMPGEHFYPHPARARSALRLSFSHATEAQADRGLSILARLVEQASG